MDELWADIGKTVVIIVVGTLIYPFLVPVLPIYLSGWLPSLFWATIIGWVLLIIYRIFKRTKGGRNAINEMFKQRH